MPTPTLWTGTIPINPTTKKNSQRIITGKHGRPFIIPSQKYQEFETDCGFIIEPPPEPIDEPVNVRVIFRRDSARRVDLTNLLEAIDDILVKFKVLADDNFKIIAAHDGSRVFIDRDNPGVDIYIEPFTG